MEYLLDFDDTLYDAKSFKEQVAIDGTGSMLFTPEIWQHYDVREYLHFDTLDWLKGKAKENLFILTAAMNREGRVVMEYQKEKLRCSGMSKLVARVVFTSEVKGDAAAEIASQFPPHETIVFVDDKIEQCLSVQVALPHAFCFLMVRNPNVIGSIDMVRGIPVVHTLADVDVKMKEL